MPTATSTLTTPSALPMSIPLKAVPLSSSPSSSSTTQTTLRSLYNRATRAFLHRDIPLAHSLLDSAFSILKPPSSFVPDLLVPYRRKWDILRITLETTIHASPPQSTELESLPESLRANLILSPQSLVSSMYTRSLDLFTPTSLPQKANAAFLPSQILMTLALSTLKLDCVAVGRGMVEDWLAQRGEFEETPLDSGGDGYEKVLEIYCLHVLPRLEQWDYAREFLQYENELPQERRDHLITSLQKLHSETLANRRPPPQSPFPSVTHTSAPPRSASPTPSSSSSSSSVSTVSTHTAVPRTPRPMNGLTPYPHINAASVLGIGPLSPAASASNTSLASTSTVTPNSTPARQHNAPSSSTAHSTHKPARSRLTSLTPEPSPTPAPRGPLASIEHFRSVTYQPSTYALIRASLGSYLTTSKLTTIIILFIVLPLVSFLLRLRRRRRQAGVAGTASTAEQVRKRLKAAGADGSGKQIVSRIWGEVLRVVGDTVKMGGSGLV